jgi:hypothetical protein
VVPIGGSIVGGYLDDLANGVRDYFGALNEIKQGLQGVKIPERPEALIRYEMVKSTGLPLKSGGLLDQPHIWLLEYDCVDNIKRIMTAVAPKKENKNALEHQ